MANEYQPLWKCRLCGSKGLPIATHRFCPNCGHERDVEKVELISSEQAHSHGPHRFHGAAKWCCDQGWAETARHCGNCGSALAASVPLKTHPEGAQIQMISDSHPLRLDWSGSYDIEGLFADEIEDEPTDRSIPVTSDVRGGIPRPDESGHSVSPGPALRASREPTGSAQRRQSSPSRVNSPVIVKNENVRARRASNSPSLERPANVQRRSTLVPPIPSGSIEPVVQRAPPSHSMVDTVVPPVPVSDPAQASDRSPIANDVGPIVPDSDEERMLATPPVGIGAWVAARLSFLSRWTRWLG